MKPEFKLLIIIWIFILPLLIVDVFFITYKEKRKPFQSNRPLIQHQISLLPLAATKELIEPLVAKEPVITPTVAIDYCQELQNRAITVIGTSDCSLVGLVVKRLPDTIKDLTIQVRYDVGVFPCGDLPDDRSGCYWINTRTIMIAAHPTQPGLPNFNANLLYEISHSIGYGDDQSGWDWAFPYLMQLRGRDL